MEVNQSCAPYLGVYIGERKIAVLILGMIFENVRMMPSNNSYYDFICSDVKQEFTEKYPWFEIEKNKEYKIDVKCSCLNKRNVWYFHIRKNVVSDMFLMIAIDNRRDLNILYTWLIEGDEVIVGGNNVERKLSSFNNFMLCNNEFVLDEYKKYNLPNEILNQMREVFRKFKEEYLDK